MSQSTFERIYIRFFVTCVVIAVPFCLMAQGKRGSAIDRISMDSDRDGLEDRLELDLGTDPSSADTDRDRLSDYEEYCKYRTDPTKSDSDGDGIPDGDRDERREYAYTIRAVIEIRPPNKSDMMTDLYQDARVVKKPGRLPDSTILELLIFPFATPHIRGRPYPYESVSPSLRNYVQKTLALNFSAEMQREVKQIIAKATTDVEAVETVINWIGNETRLVNSYPEFACFHVVDNRIRWLSSLGSSDKDRQLLETNFYGDSMFKNRVHGTCTSLATLRGTMLRAAGIPTRIIQTLPLIQRYEGDPEPLVDRMRRRILAKGYERDVNGRGQGANHAYNEVFLNNHWIRVDQTLNTGPFVGDKLFVKVYSTDDWNNLFVQRPPEELWNENRDFRTLSVSDRYAKYRTEFETIDISVSEKGLSVTRRADGQYEASVLIHNAGNNVSPAFSVNFYARAPDRARRLLSQHTAGPIMPRSIWREGTHPFRLEEGEDQVVVVLDEENSVNESDEANNQAFKNVYRNDPQGASTEVSAGHAPGTPVDIWISNADIHAYIAREDSAFEGRRRVAVTIHSRGAGTLEKVESKFYIGGPKQGGRLIGTGCLSMEAGQTAGSEISFDVPEEELEIHVIVDPENRIAESNETNNTASRAFIVKGGSIREK